MYQRKSLSSVSVPGTAVRKHESEKGKEKCAFTRRQKKKKKQQTKIYSKSIRYLFLLVVSKILRMAQVSLRKHKGLKRSTQMRVRQNWVGGIRGERLGQRQVFWLLCLLVDKIG